MVPVVIFVKTEGPPCPMKINIFPFILNEINCDMHSEVFSKVISISASFLSTGNSNLILRNGLSKKIHIIISMFDKCNVRITDDDSIYAQRIAYVLYNNERIKPYKLHNVRERSMHFEGRSIESAITKH